MAALILLGFLCGILSGMGVGGGTLMVPALIYFWHISQLCAQGVIIAVFLPTALVASIRHYRKRLLNPAVSLLLVFGALPAGFLGSFFAHHMDKHWLSVLFGLFLIVSALLQFYTFFKSWKKN